MKNKLVSFLLVSLALSLAGCVPSSNQQTYSLSKDNAVSFSSDGAGSFKANGIDFALTKAKASSSGWFTLSQGGYLTNSSAAPLSFSSITVTFASDAGYGSLTAKASYYPISSPENGAYEVTNGTALSFEGKGNRYFCLSAPVGSFTITSISLLSAGQIVAPASATTLDFYTINDTHGAADFIASSSQAGINRLSTFAMTTSRKAPENTLFLSSGDMWQGSADSNLTHGELMVNWMNLVGFTSMAIGNHEFDWKPAAIATNAAIANFPFLGINIVDSQGVRPSWAKASLVVERSGVKIGIIGAVGLLENSIAVSSLSGYSFARNYVTLVENEAQRLKKSEGCELVVLSVHNGDFDTGNCRDVDAVFEGHSHSAYIKTDLYGIPHLQAGSNGTMYQHARFSKANGKWSCSLTSSVPFASLSVLAEEPMTLSLRGYYAGKTDPIKNEVIGSTASSLSKETLAHYGAQCLFEYYANANWDSALALAAINYGGVRQSIPAGNVTYGQVYAVFPFDNDNVLCTCSGAFVQELANSTYLASYSSPSLTIDRDKTYSVMVLSYISEKEEYAANLTEVKRDDYRIRDIVADDFRRQANG